MARIVILTSDTGEGHNSTAAALDAAARAAGIETAIHKPIEGSGNAVRLFTGLYNTLLQRRPQWVAHYFRWIERYRPNEVMYPLFRGYIRKFLDRARPEVLLSVHPMLNHAIQRFIHEDRRDVFCPTFVTDPYPPFWKGWVSPWIDRYLAPTQAAADELVRLGASAKSVEVTPMPVRPEFRPADPQAVRATKDEFGLDGDSLILLNGGARGGGPLLDVYRTIRGLCPQSAIVAICGRNAALRTKMQSLADARTKILGFRPDIHRLVAASDLILTKPGALATYEALACRVPVVLLGIGALMPQESGLFAAIEGTGAGYAVRTFEELSRAVAEGPAAWSDRRPAIERFYAPGSGREIVERAQPSNVGP